MKSINMTQTEKRIQVPNKYIKMFHLTNNQSNQSKLKQIGTM